MEAELAVLKDLGYNVPLRKFFGKSYYLNNLTLQEHDFTTGYSEWDGTSYTGAPSTTTQGVGVHIYGNKYKINQKSDILTAGEGAIGARIEGEDNIYTVKSGYNIQANGKENLGLAVTWGQNHTVNVENGSSVTATGQDGIAASFDFGGNIFGIYQNAKGSYINYDASQRLNITPDSDLQGALVENFNVTGTLSGSKAAIYISDNAHVENININDGAVINGDIKSEWNSVSSGLNASVQYKDGEGNWHPINKEAPEKIYYTNLKFNGDGTNKVVVNGDITGENEIQNTLRIYNLASSVLNFNGEEINVNSFDNLGTINIKNAEISSQNGQITGAGSLNVLENGKLTIASTISSIVNPINLADGSNLSTVNDKTTSLNISELNIGTDASISFDLGDTFNIAAATGTAKINQIMIDDNTIKTLEDGDSYSLFESGSIIPAITGVSNAYYNGNKYTLSQSGTNITVALTATGTELSDAAGDPTTPSYIVTEGSLSTDAGTVKGDIFTIKGKDINVNGHNGLVIDGDDNSEGTVLRTGIAGASNANITLVDKGNLLVDAEDKDIVLGNVGEVALAINDSEVKLDASQNTIDIQGAISGTGTNTNNKLTFTGNEFRMYDVNNVKIDSDAKIVNMFGTNTNTILNMNKTVLNVINDSYLASDGTNTLNLNNSVLNLANNKPTDINLAGMALASSNLLTIDIDVESLKSDRFVFQGTDKLDTTNSTGVTVYNVNLMNPTLAYTDEERYIPFISPEAKNQNLLGLVSFADARSNIITPIFKYNLGYTEDVTLNQGGFLFSRGATKDYNSYNPAVVASSVAAQFGGYLSQLNSYEQAFQNLDMKMLMTREERQALRMANIYASTETPKVFSPIYLPEKDKGAWFRPYATFEKAGLRNGPKVENISYGSYYGGDSPIYTTKNGWDCQYSVYAGYNGSHQNYAGNSVYQNGGTLGATGIWYKGDFFTALTANVGASVADAHTMYGSEDMTMLMAGLASKTGYNWELARGKFIIQPSFLMSYSFVNTFDYTNAAGVKIKSNPLNAINIAPGLKFIGNLKHGWQPYVGVQMVWNIMDKTHFKANDVALPNMSVKPYIQYGVGVQKRWGERFTSFFQAMMRNGGRNGVALSAGFRWALGK